MVRRSVAGSADEPKQGRRIDKCCRKSLLMPRLCRKIRLF
jgi:hypothetical protein